MPELLLLTQEEIARLKELVKFIKDYEAWGRLGKYIKTIIAYMVGIGASIIVFKEQIEKVLGAIFEGAAS